MPYRINGIGTTVAPIPAPGQFSVAMHWFTIFFIPVVPLGWQFIQGAENGRYYVVKKITHQEALKFLGIKGVVLTIGWGFLINIIMLIFVIGVLYTLSYLRRL